MLHGSKTGCFCPSESKGSRIHASISTWDQNFVLMLLIGLHSIYEHDMIKSDP